MSRKRLSLVVLPILLALAALWATPASAAPADATRTGAAPEARGQLVLFENPYFTGTTQVFDVATCAPQLAQLRGQVASYDNQPVAGCQASLTNSAGAQLRLCVGRALVPEAFRVAPLLTIQPGTSLPCPTGPGGVRAGADDTDVAGGGAASDARLPCGYYTLDGWGWYRHCASDTTVLVYVETWDNQFEYSFCVGPWENWPIDYTTRVSFAHAIGLCH
ncbi:DUF6355 family natural product biosynthesis protein [Micromonospora sp. NPDC049559]|uniref:DUF6355 family natural product biosynthesis protein n=1 Tax=Micromonospora sp. NPDC049559 TaxID=3155923 RepID=UPI00344AE47A